MGKNLLCRKIYIYLQLGLIAALFVPFTLGTDSSINETTNLNRSLPDLVVDDIYIDMTYNGPGPLFPDLFCRIRNLGDAPVGNLNYRVIITHMLFNRIPIKTIVNTTLGVGFIPPMPPGGAYADVLPTGSPAGNNLPLFGFIKVEVTVNPQDFYPIPESNYSNNYYTETFFEINPIILGQVQWFSLE